MQFHDVEQNTEVWDELRLGKATASNFAKFMANDGSAFGEPAKDYALKIALEIATGKKAEFSFKNDDMERGQIQEPIARMLYEEETFSTVTNGGFFCHGTYGDSPDGLVGSDGVVEIKSVIAKTHYATQRRKSFDPSYKWQLLGHLDCTGRKWVDFVSYCADFPEGQQLIIHRLHAENWKEDIERLVLRREKFLELVESTYISLKEPIYG